MGTWRGRAPVSVRLGAVAALLGAVAGLPAQGARAAGAAVASAAPAPYAFAEDAERIDGADSAAGAVRLEPGTVYRSSLPRSGKAFYRLELDGTTNAYVSATAVPPPGSAVSALDGIRVSVRNDDGRSCSPLATERFGADGSPRPVTAWGAREISPARSLCRRAGAYYVSVERVGRAGEGPAPQAWDLELAAVTEPRLERAGASAAPEAWNSASPRPLSGEAGRRRGGAGFFRATPLGQGIWQDDIRPGRTLFYKVPVDWGQQLYVTAELSGPGPDATGFVAGALDLSLHNPARGRVEDVDIGYDGRQKSGSLPPLPPAGYANRYAAAGKVRAMRFAGSYYLVAHLAQKVAGTFGDGPFELTLRVRVSGTPQAGPGYAGESVPRDVFEVTGRDREAAAEGVSAGSDTAMRALAFGGIGTGSVLLVGLGVWTAVARRGASS